MDTEPVRPARREIGAVHRCVVGVDVTFELRRNSGREVPDRLEPDAGERRKLHETVQAVLDAAGQPLELSGMRDREDV